MRAIIAALVFLAAVGAAEAQGLAKATFAGGCFWCMEPPFDKLDGVVSTTSGYIGGHMANPTYEQVSAGKTGHTEAVEIVYDPRKVTYAQLLDVFWRNIDPADRQRTVLRHGQPVPKRRLRARRDAAQAGRGFERRGGCAVGKTDRDRDRGRVDVLARGATTRTITRTPSATSTTASSCGRDRRLEELWGPAPKDSARDSLTAHNQYGVATSSAPGHGGVIGDGAGEQCGHMPHPISSGGP